MRSWPKTLGNRLYRSLSTPLSIRRPGVLLCQTRTYRLSAKATLEITGRKRDPRRDGPEFGIGKIGPTART